MFVVGVCRTRLSGLPLLIRWLRVDGKIRRSWVPKACCRSDLFILFLCFPPNEIRAPARSRKKYIFLVDNISWGTSCTTTWPWVTKMFILQLLAYGEWWLWGWPMMRSYPSITCPMQSSLRSACVPKCNCIYRPVKPLRHRETWRSFKLISECRHTQRYWRMD